MLKFTEFKKKQFEDELEKLAEEKERLDNLGQTVPLKIIHRIQYLADYLKGADVLINSLKNKNS